MDPFSLPDLEPTFSDKQGKLLTTEENYPLFNFIMKFLPYLIQNESVYPKSLKALAEKLIKYLCPHGPLPKRNPTENPPHFRGHP